MKIEAGKCYARRDGVKEGPMQWVLGGMFESNNCRWLPDGSIYALAQSPFDLIAEWTDATIGTLADHDVKTGDVVRSRNGKVYKVLVQEGGKVCDADDGQALVTGRRWTVVSRAPRIDGIRVQNGASGLTIDPRVVFPPEPLPPHVIRLADGSTRDLSQNREAFRLMPQEAQDAMRAWDGGV